MLDTVLRFWQQHIPARRLPREEPETALARAEPSKTSPGPRRAEMAFTSVDVGNYA